MFAPKQKSIDYEFLYQSQMKQNKELNEQHELLGNHVKQQNLRIAKLEKKYLEERNAYLQERDKCEKLEQDAARYRWLRDHYHGFEHYRAKWMDGVFEREIDAAIRARGT